MSNVKVFHLLSPCISAIYYQSDRFVGEILETRGCGEVVVHVILYLMLATISQVLLTCAANL